MNALDRVTDHAPIAAPPNGQLMRLGTEALSDFARRIDALVAALDELAEIGDDTTRKCAERLALQLDLLQPSVTMIGQVKAGKTSLVNAMAGLPDLLPADVNPWTSVVTALHLSPTGFQDETRARFTFFAEDEWSRLVNRGGRIGELASRAGADDELEKVRRQLNEMREKSKARLGKKFEMLLGQSHDYGYFDQPLIERYVCLGDDFGDQSDTSRAQGRFADITRSADLFIERPDLPMGLCIRDTPGVNDTFMMREQITIRAIRESRLCVVVLSAHQALSNVDLALIRLISNVKSREVIIFVNRIDELAKPSEQVPEIAASIRATLAAHQGPVDAEIVFGSAYWANKALTAKFGSMDPASAEALLDWAQHALKSSPSSKSPERLIWDLSGVPALMRALSARIVEGAGHEALERTAKSALNLVQALRASGRIDDQLVPAEVRIDRQTMDSRLKRIEAQSRAALTDKFGGLETEFRSRLDRAHQGFLERATASLIAHLERHGDGEIWKYDPSGLRLLLRSAFQVFSSQMHRQVQATFDDTATALGRLYVEAFALPEENFKVQPPPAPRVPPPVQIGQTIALDLKGNWWRRWWQRRRGYQLYAAEFSQMIAAETAPVLDDLKEGTVREVGREAGAILGEFLETQRKLLQGLAERAAEPQPAAPGRAAGSDGQLDRLAATFAEFV